MRRGSVFSGFWLGALLASSAPAHAAENLTCAAVLVDEKVNAEVFKAYRANVEIGEKITELIGKKFAACILNNDWSQEAAESAMRVLFGEILERGLGEELRKYPKVSIAALRLSTDSFFESIPAGDLRKFADGELGDDGAVPLVQRLIADAVVTQPQLDDEDLARLIGEFAAARANSKVFRAIFDQQ